MEFVAAHLYRQYCRVGVASHSLTTDDKGGLYIAEEGRDRISVYEKLPDFTGAFKLHRVLDAYQDIVSLAVTGNSTQSTLRFFGR